MLLFNPYTLVSLFFTHPPNPHSTPSIYSPLLPISTHSSSFSFITVPLSYTLTSLTYCPSNSCSLIHPDQPLSLFILPPPYPYINPCHCMSPQSSWSSPLHISIRLYPLYHPAPLLLFFYPPSFRILPYAPFPYHFTFSPDPTNPLKSNKQ